MEQTTDHSTTPATQAIQESPQVLSTTLLEDAHEAAKYQVTSWIQAVLRETVVQATAATWTVIEEPLALLPEQPNEDTNAVTKSPHWRVTLDDDALASIRHTCRRVAHQWSIQLQAIGHGKVAEWIDEVVRTKEATLYRMDDAHPASTPTNHSTQSPHASVARIQTSETNEAAAVIPPTIRRKDPPTESEIATGMTNDNDEPTTIPPRATRRRDPPTASEIATGIAHDDGDLVPIRPHAASRRDPPTASETTTASGDDSPVAIRPDATIRNKDPPTACQTVTRRASGDDSPATIRPDATIRNTNPPMACQTTMVPDDSATRGDPTQLAASVTHWSTLRRLGQHDPCSTLATMTLPNHMPQHYRDMIAVLDDLGQGNRTYWPGSQWHVIQEAAAAIAARLYPGSWSDPNDAKPHESTVTLDTTLGSTPNATENVQLLLDRKRKSTNRKKLHPSHRPAKLPRVDAETSVELVTLARPPSDHGTARWHWQNDILSDGNWTATERAQLVAYLHNATDGAVDTDNDDSPDTATTAPFVLLGALRDVGRFRFSLGDRSVDESLTPKQRRRIRREAIQSRLGDHVPLESKKERATPNGKAGASSRLIRTVETTGSATEHGDGCRYWIDLDLGHCLLEGLETGVPDGSAITNSIPEAQPNPPCRRLYAFRNIELLLLDEYESR